MPKIDVPEIPVSAAEKQYVTIPERDIFDMSFAQGAIQINNMRFESGKTHFVEPQIAATLQERIRAVERANIRLMQPRKDANAEAACSKGVATGVQTTSF